MARISVQRFSCQNLRQTRFPEVVDLKADALICTKAQAFPESVTSFLFGAPMGAGCMTA